MAGRAITGQEPSSARVSRDTPTMFLSQAMKRRMLQVLDRVQVHEQSLPGMVRDLQASKQRGPRDWSIGGCGVLDWHDEGNQPLPLTNRRPQSPVEG